MDARTPGLSAALRGSAVDRGGSIDKSARKIASVAAVLLFMLPMLGHAESAEFRQCLTQLGATARHNGISVATANRVIASVEQVPRVIESDRNQPEFVSSFARYLERHVTPERVVLGRVLLRKHAALLRAIADEYGVPPKYLVAIWGLETNYGRFLGHIPVFDSLATLACDRRRSSYFADEFVAALRIVDRGHIDPATMAGSWAGAMGQTQFMPSTYLAHAVDGNGDGVIDIWNEMADALASAANFLRDLGWRSGWRWGREVVLPADFDYTLAGRAHSLSLAQWRRMGVRETDGSQLPALAEPASVLVPAGYRGPAFLIYANFRTIMSWNPSELFALSVGRLADRIAGAGPLRNPPPAAPRLRRDTVKRLQRTLNELGFDCGEPDGIVGPATRAAVRAWQDAHGYIADGYVDTQLLRRFNIAVR